MEKVLEIYRWIADVFLPPGNVVAEKPPSRKATMEGKKGLLEGGAGARGAGCSREPESALLFAVWYSGQAAVC